MSSHAMSGSVTGRPARAGAAAILAIAVAGCGGSAIAPAASPAASPSAPGAVSTPAQSDARPSPSAAHPTSAPPAPPLQATWTRDQSCAETIALFDQLGLHQLGAEYLTGIGFRSESKDVVAADAMPCRGAAGPFRRTLFFRAGGRWGGTLLDEQVDDGTISDLTNRSFVLPGDAQSPDVAMEYAIDGAAIRFQVRPPDPCSTLACREQVAWANETFTLGPWTRQP